MTVSSGTKACYGAAGICLCCGFLLSVATTGVLLMMLRDDPNLLWQMHYDYWLTAVMVITFSFAVLSVGIVMCGCAVVKHCVCGEAEEEDEEAPADEENEEEADGDDVEDAEGDETKKAATEEAAEGDDDEDEKKANEGSEGDDEAEPDEESEKAEEEAAPERNGSADSLLPGAAKE